MSHFGNKNPKRVSNCGYKAGLFDFILINEISIGCFVQLFNENAIEKFAKFQKFLKFPYTCH